MNNILELKGRFNQKSNNSRPGAPKLPKGSIVNSSDLIFLRDNLIKMRQFWMSNTLFNGALISVYYNKTAAKSNRVTKLLAAGSAPPNSTIVGAKFAKKHNKHIITHHIPIKAIDDSIYFINKVIALLDTEFQGTISTKVFNDKNTFSKIDFTKYNIAKTNFQKIIVDVHYVEKFDVEQSDFASNRNAIITIYDTGEDTQELLNRIGINVYNHNILNDTTILLDENYLQILMQKAPYLVAMATEDMSKLAPSNFKKTVDDTVIQIPSPGSEPTIGVIDTLFDDRVYFADWVESVNMLDSSIPVDADDYKHGTAVSSIIVDGPTLNPSLDDSCGRFKVRHFGIATRKAFSSFTIIRAIKEIVASNKDIRVWNLSLGSNDEINDNFISAEAAVLDQIQYENDVIFIVAGTNKNINSEDKKIGSPADSINSIVVNSVNNNHEPAEYSRKGIVLSFFNKPDISYYGGTSSEYMKVCEPLGKALVTGTSYAAPWIARKMAYLIDIIGFSKEVAKAVLIDAAIGWTPNTDLSSISLKGFGVVPIKINDIINSKEDEIKFVVSGISEKYDTFNYNFPVPIHKDKHPYIAKATLCYFPKCSRNQGVDYTNTELDIYFGRLKDDGKLVSINNNQQSIEGLDNYLTEEDARKLFRKWDNVKHISEKIIENPRPRKAYQNHMWGMSVKTKERLNNRDGEGIRFGVVVTLKEMYGVNRIEEFIQQCSFNGWLVNKIDIENKIDIYETANEELKFD